MTKSSASARASPPPLDLPSLIYKDEATGDIRIHVPLQTLCRHYYFGVRPFLHEPNSEAEEKDDDTSDFMEDEVAEEENEAEDKDREDLQEHQPAKVKKKKRTKISGKRKRRPQGGDAEYDYEDPFIDDSAEVGDAGFVSIFDMLSGRVDLAAAVNEASDDRILSDNPSANDDDNDSTHQKQQQFEFAKRPQDRHRDFFVYEGPLMLGRTLEADFEPRRRNRRKQPARKSKKGSREKRPSSEEKDAPSDPKPKKPKKLKTEEPLKPAPVPSTAGPLANLFEDERESQAVAVKVEGVIATPSRRPAYDQEKVA